MPDDARSPSQMVNIVAVEAADFLFVGQARISITIAKTETLVMYFFFSFKMYKIRKKAKIIEQGNKMPIRKKQWTIKTYTIEEFIKFLHSETWN